MSWIPPPHWVTDKFRFFFASGGYVLSSFLCTIPRMLIFIGQTILKFRSTINRHQESLYLRCPKCNPNFRDITKCTVEENEIFSVESRFRCYNSCYSISRKIDSLGQCGLKLQWCSNLKYPKPTRILCENNPYSQDLLQPSWLAESLFSFDL